MMQQVFTHSMAMLRNNNIRFRKIHDLLAFLNQFSVVFRYPGETANKEHAKKAVDAKKFEIDFNY